MWDRRKPQRQRARHARGRVVILYEGTIEPGKSGFDPLARRSNDNDQRTSARGGGLIRHMADERLAREVRENLGRVGIAAEACAAAGRQNDRGDKGVLFPAQSGGLRRAQRLAPHRRDHFGENGDGDLGWMNRADIEPDRRVNDAELRIGKSLAAETIEPLGMGFLRAQRADIEAFRAQRRDQTGIVDLRIMGQSRKAGESVEPAAAAARLAAIRE